MKIQAIPTKFNGTVYRSRTEAKWAWFFDHHGIPVQYEPEGFQTEAGWYLPDFQLLAAPRLTYFEVKPHQPTKREYRLLRALAKEAEAHVFVAHGAPSSSVFIEKVYSTSWFEQWFFALNQFVQLAFLANAPFGEGLALPIRPYITPMEPGDQAYVKRCLDEAGSQHFDTHREGRIRCTRELRESALVRQIREERRVVKSQERRVMTSEGRIIR